MSVTVSSPTTILPNTWPTNRLQEVRDGVFSPTEPPIPVCYPPTGELVIEVPTSTVSSLTAHIPTMRQAQRAWAKRTPKNRAQIMLRFHDLLFQHQQAMLDLIQLETGKARQNALEEVFDTAINAR
ncbi:aldehyde dehydrogenase family protein, partial [Arthrospira platensis SPKY1]|nr:aldehyde dehydrogenase family protein [Arthrospira platensis SPKY1]